jgi:hypothetical protein
MTAPLPASRPAAPSDADDTATLLAAGVLAYIAETMLHEAGGHGVVCIAGGGHVTLLAPLFMRCSQTGLAMIAAGPLANVVGAALVWAALRWARRLTPLAGLLLWLSFAFNALVACGYLFVGAATGFGDWPALFAWVDPPIAWRLPAALCAAGLYIGCLFLAAWRFRALAASGDRARARLRRRALIPAAGAAVMACAAELAGGRMSPMPLLLALGCTLAVGYSLTAMDGSLAAPHSGDRDLGPVPRKWWFVALAIAVAAWFVVVVGPGWRL